MRLPDPTQLEEVGLTLYERKALLALMVCGVADAATLCREGDVPTSKIYLALEKLAGLGLVQTQPTRPRMFAALPVDTVVARVVDLARERAERFAAAATDLSETLRAVQSRVRGRQPFVDLALGVDAHVRRHLVPLAAARKRILSYLERGDLMGDRRRRHVRLSNPSADREERRRSWRRTSHGLRLLVPVGDDAG